MIFPSTFFPSFLYGVAVNWIHLIFLNLYFVSLHTLAEIWCASSIITALIYCETSEKSSSENLLSSVIVITMIFEF